MPEAALHPSTLQYVRSRQIAAGYDEHFSDEALFTYDRQWLAQCFDQPGRLLDLGCGTGRHVVQFAHRCFDVVGVDLSEAMLAQAQAKLQAQGLYARLLHADICRLPIGHHRALFPESFDYAICMFSTLGLIYGSQNRLGVLQDVAKFLAPGGRLALHVHNHSYNLWCHEGRVFLLTNYIQTRLGLAEPGDKFISHYRGIRNMYLHLFTEQEITALLQQAGFTLHQVLPLNRRRTAPLKPTRLRSLRANGFLILAQKSMTYDNNREKKEKPLCYD